MFQKKNFQNGTLSKDREIKLDKVEFIWNILEYDWNKGYEETVKYKKKTGKANCVDVYVTKSGYGLGGWQGHQRSNYKTGRSSA